MTDAEDESLVDGRRVAVTSGTLVRYGLTEGRATGSKIWVYLCGVLAEGSTHPRRGHVGMSQALRRDKLRPLTPAEIHNVGGDYDDI